MFAEERVFTLRPEIERDESNVRIQWRLTINLRELPDLLFVNVHNVIL